MCYYLSLDTLPSFGITDISKSLRTGGYSLSRIDSLPLEVWDSLILPPLCFSIFDSWTGERIKGRRIDLSLRRNKRGLYLDIQYSLLSGGDREDVCLRYRIVRRESNMIPGTYRYYFENPYSRRKGERLCSKLYFFPDSGEFLPRSVLYPSGVLYSQQRRGHFERYYLGLSYRVPDWESLRYRKTHYRGKETKFWSRYRRLQEETEDRFIELTLGRAVRRGMYPKGVEKEVLENYYRHSGRKSPTGREKVSQKGKQTPKRR
jgi:hypothetical protein